jgi:hypothetical protein
VWLFINSGKWSRLALCQSVCLVCLKPEVTHNWTFAGRRLGASYNEQYTLAGSDTVSVVYGRVGTRLDERLVEERKLGRNAFVLSE